MKDIFKNALAGAIGGTGGTGGTGGGTRWIGLREIREITTYRHARDGVPQANQVSVRHGAMVEAMWESGEGVWFGYAATPRLDETGVGVAIERAVGQARSLARLGVPGISRGSRPLSRGERASPVSRPFGSVSPAEINGTLVDICRRLKVSEKVIRAEAMVMATETECCLLDSEGSEVHQRFAFLTHDFAATACDGPVVQKRTSGGLTVNSYQGGWETFLTDRLWSRVEQVGREAVELVSAPDCPTGRSNLVLLPTQMALQIHESIGHPLEVDRILGDERNYAGWSFVKPEDFGKLRYGSDALNITFDPEVPGEFAGYAFDDNGAPARKEYLIRDGILLRGLGGLESQSRSGIPGVANARACLWNRPPIDRMANLNLEPGEASMQELLDAAGDGILMDSNRSWSIDDFRNKFQFGCELAREIKGGKLGRVLRNPGYRGISASFWRSLALAGDRSTFAVYGLPNCGKGEPNQLIRVGHASPACLFRDVEIFGGAA